MTLKRGLNLGGYLSQCVHTTEHHETFIGEKDIKQIAHWGFDHVRVPVDYEVLEEENGAIKEDGYNYLERLFDWCEHYNLDAILDLHKAYGYDFNDTGKEGCNTLFEDAHLQERFVQLWKNIASRFGTYSHVAFELLNEVVEEENADAWNALIKQTVTAIRGITDTPIIYGGIQWNSANTVKLLEVPTEKNIIFTFHFYEPLLFTHQKAYWVKNMNPDREILYPESMQYYQHLSQILGYQGNAVVKAKATTMGIEFIDEMISGAVTAAKAAGVPLYCGEFGVIDQAPVADTLHWFKDVHQVFEKHNIGCSIWSYKEMDFGLIDSHYEEIRSDLIRLWTSRQF